MHRRAIRAAFWPKYDHCKNLVFLNKSFFIQYLFPCNKIFGTKKLENKN